MSKVLSIFWAFSLFLNAQFSKTGFAMNSLSSKGISRPNGLKVFLGRSPQTDPQSLSLDFKSVSIPERFEDDQESTSLEDSGEMHSSDASLDLLETSKENKREGNEIVDTEDYMRLGKESSRYREPNGENLEHSMFVNDYKTDKARGSNKDHRLQERRGDVKEQYLHARSFTRKSQGKGDFRSKKEKPYEVVTKMTLHSILLQPEKGVSDNSIQEDQNMHSKFTGSNSAASKTVNPTGKRTSDRKITGDGQFGKEKIIYELKETFSGSANATPDEIASSEGSNIVESGQFSDHKRIKRTSLMHDSTQIRGEAEFPGSDPLAVFLETSASAYAESSDHETAVDRHWMGAEGNNIEEEQSGSPDPELSRRDPLTTFLGETSRRIGDGYSGNEVAVRSHPLDAGGENSGEVTSSITVFNEKPGAVHIVLAKVHDKDTSQRENATREGIKSFDPLLLLQVRNIRMNVLRAEKQAINDLYDVRTNLRLKMEDLMKDLKVVRRLTKNVHRKVGWTVKKALEMTRLAKSNATSRLNMARRAAKALNNIEKQLDVLQTRNASKILRSRIPEYSGMKDASLYKQLLETNKMLTKLDGAKELAIYRAEKRFRNEEKTGSSITAEVDTLKDELASAEKELTDETGAEMEDEREAQQKIDEAIRRNKLVSKKTAYALGAIENYLQKLQSDERKLKQLRFY